MRAPVCFPRRIRQNCNPTVLNGADIAGAVRDPREPTITPGLVFFGRGRRDRNGLIVAGGAGCDLDFINRIGKRITERPKRRRVIAHSAIPFHEIAGED